MWGGGFSYTWPDGMCHSTGSTFVVKNYAAECLFQTKIGLDKKGSCIILAKFYTTGYTFGKFSCDRVHGAESFPTHPRYVPCQVLPPRGYRSPKSSPEKPVNALTLSDTLPLEHHILSSLGDAILWYCHNLTARPDPLQTLKPTFHLMIRTLANMSSTVYFWLIPAL